jgi:hypothetical protein
MHCAQFASTPGENIIAGFSTGTCYELSEYILIDIHVGSHILTQPFPYVCIMRWSELYESCEMSVKYARYKYANRRRVT